MVSSLSFSGTFFGESRYGDNLKKSHLYRIIPGLSSEVTRFT